MSSKKKQKKPKPKSPKLGSGMAEKARKQLKGRGAQVNAILESME